MTPLDQKTELHYRQVAMNMAIASHGENQDHVSVLVSAQKYYDFLNNHQMSVDAPDLPQMTVAFRTPSGLPDDWTGPAPLPAETLDSVMVKDVSLTELQEMRRRQLFELDTVANAIKAKGAVPC